VGFFQRGLRERGISWNEAVTEASKTVAAQAARDLAMTYAEAGGDPAWQEAARHAVWWLACNRETFTVDDVWALLDEREVPRPPEPRALGPILMRALRKGAIRDTGKMARSVRRNASKITVYARGATS
jgi:hypothetical protein